MATTQNPSKDAAGVPERHPAGEAEVGALNPVSPDAVSPEERSPATRASW